MCGTSILISAGVDRGAVEGLQHLTECGLSIAVSGVSRTNPIEDLLEASSHGGPYLFHLWERTNHACVLLRSAIETTLSLKLTFGPAGRVGCTLQLHDAIGQASSCDLQPVIVCRIRSSKQRYLDP